MLGSYAINIRKILLTLHNTLKYTKEIKVAYLNVTITRFFSVPKYSL